jgi:hypothetical protein
VNIFAANWFLKGLRGNSVTFALLFASCVVGYSVSNLIHLVLERLGVHWLYVMILPVVFFTWLAKREDRFIPDEAQRKRWARGLIAGSIALALLIAWIKN